MEHWVANSETGPSVVNLSFQPATLTAIHPRPASIAVLESTRRMVHGTAHAVLFEPRSIRRLKRTTPDVLVQADIQVVS
jgi:hypothetical protein